MFASGLPPSSRFPHSPGVPKHHLATTAAAAAAVVLRRKRLGILLRSSFQEFYRFQSCGIEDFWHERSLLPKSYTFVKTLPGFLSGSFSSCLYFFSGKESEKGLGDKGKSHLGTPGGNSSNERLWTNALLAINVIHVTVSASTAAAAALSLSLLSSIIVIFVFFMPLFYGFSIARAYAAQIATDGKLMLWGAKINSLIDEGELWRLVTSSFLHANIGHLLVNCYSLNSVGPTVEKISGPGRFLTVYFTSAIASSTLSYYLCKAPAVGASGAVFGLVGSFAMFVLRHRDLVRGAKEDLQQIAHVLALNLVIGLLSKGIDNWGHLGGLLGGATVSWFLGPAWRYEYQLHNRKAVFVDRAPVFRLLNNKRRKH